MYPTRRQFIQSMVGFGAIVGGTQIASASTGDEFSNPHFDVGRLPDSIGFLADPKARQREAWEFACDLRDAENAVDDELQRYTTQDFETLFSSTNAARTDLRSVGRLLEAFHEHGLASYIDENYLYALGGKADVVLRYAPLIGSMNNVLKTAETFANAPEGDRRGEYELFVLTIVCFCLELGLFYVGAPYKLAWKGTHKIFFARSGTLFRLGRYGGDRFVGFIMSEVHYELREALFDNVVAADKAQWVIEQVNEQHEIPEFTSLRDEGSEYVENVQEFTKDELKQHEYAQEFIKGSAQVGYGWTSEFVESLPEKWSLQSESKSTAEGAGELVLRPDPEWHTKENDDESDGGGLFGLLQ